MPANVHIGLAVDRQVLSIVERPPVFANGTIDRMSFDVQMSHEWDMLPDCYVIMRRAGGDVRACKIDAATGHALADNVALRDSGVLEVAIMGTDGKKRMTTGIATIALADSGVYIDDQGDEPEPEPTPVN